MLHLMLEGSENNSFINLLNNADDNTDDCLNNDIFKFSNISLKSDLGGVQASVKVIQTLLFGFVGLLFVLFRL